MSPAQITNTAIGLAFAQGQLQNALREEERWQQREQEARAHRLLARQRVVELQKDVQAHREALAPTPRHAYSPNTYT